MAGRNPREAFAAFIEPLQQNVSCLANDVLIVSSGGRHLAQKVHALTLANGPIRVTDQLTLTLDLMYEIIRTDEPGKGPYKVSTKAYDYAFRSQDGRVVTSYHWHPLGRSNFTDPHFHVPSQWPGMHLPSERTSIESVIRFCIRELGSEPNGPDWEQVLALNEGRLNSGGLGQ